MKKVLSIQGESIDAVCNRALGGSNLTEKVMAMNPHLLAFGPILPAGTEVTLPEIRIDESRQLKQPAISLWD